MMFFILISVLAYSSAKEVSFPELLTAEYVISMQKSSGDESDLKLCEMVTISSV